MKSKTLWPLLVISCLLIVFLLVFFLLHHEEKKKKEPLQLTKAYIKEEINLLQKKEFVLKGIETSLKILKKKPFEKIIFFERPISSKAIINALKGLKKDIENGLSFNNAIRKNFLFFRIKKGVNEPKLLLTGYYQVELEGSLQKDNIFKVPVLKPPKDLIKIRLRDFNKTLPSLILWGRVKDQRLFPYFTRKEIEEKIKEFDALCWLKDPVDLLELQIQGSGIININGKKYFIHYAASNGRPYFSIGKELLKRGILRKEQLSWQGIKKWAQKEPQLFKEILYQNERYIFFKWEKDGPIGCFNEKIIEGISAAFDQSVYPPGIPLIVKTKLPKLTLNLPWLKKNLTTNTLLVFNHDSGSAIKGPFRADLYTGSGITALDLAGRLKQPSDLIILLPRNLKTVKNE